MNLHRRWTSIDAYRDLDLEQEQKKVLEWLMSRRAKGGTQAEAEIALNSVHAHKRFADLVDTFHIRRTGDTRKNSLTNRENELYIASPKLRQSVLRKDFEPLFKRFLECKRELGELITEIHSVLREEEDVQKEIYTKAHETFGPEWEEDKLNE